MKRYSNKITHTLAKVVATSALFTATLHAANIWDGGGGDGLWSTALNWDNDATPAATGQTLTFTGDIQTTTTNDTLAGITAVNGFNFSNDGTVGINAFSLAGDPLTLAGNITTTATSSPITDTISLGLSLNGDRQFTTNTDHDLTISGIISDDGNRQLVKKGPGVLTLSGANTFGRLNHDEGTVRAGAANVFGDDYVDVANGATLDLNGFDQTIGGLNSGSPGGNVTLGSGTLTFGNSSGRTFYGGISGSGKIIFVGTTQSSFGTSNTNAPTNTHTGGTQIDGNRLRVYTDASLGGPSGDVIFNGGTLYIAKTMTSPASRGLVLNNVAGSRILFQGNQDWTINGPISGDGGITLRQNPNGDTIANLYGTNTFKGALRIQGTSGGAMRVWISNLADSPTANGNIIFGNEYFSLNDNNTTTLYLHSSATAPLTFANRSIEFEGDGDATGYLRNDNSTHAITVSTDLVNSGTGLKYFNLYASNATPVNVFSGAISDGSGTVKLRKAGNGEWTLSGANTHSGGTELAAGTLIVDSAGGDALGAGPLNRTGGTLILGANQNVSELFVNGVQQPNGVYTSADFTWLSDGVGGPYTLTVGSVLPVYWDLNDSTAGAGSTAGVADGTWDGSNTFWSDSAAGDVATATWTAGRAATFSAGTDANDTSTVTVDGTQSIGGLTFEEGDVTLASGTAPELSLANDALVIVNNGTTGTIDAPITGAQGLTVSTAGSGTLTLGGTNTYTGTTNIAAGKLVAGSTTALGTGPVTFSGGTLSVNATGAAGDFSSPARIVNSASAITVDTNGESVTMAGDIDSTNTGGLIKQGTGTLTLTGTNTYSGATTPGSGSLVVDGGSISNSSLSLSVNGSAMSIVNGGTLNASGNGAFAANDITMTVLGGSGVTSTWNLGNNRISTVNNSRDNQQMVIDGAGFAGSAVVTNVNELWWGRTNNNSTITITDGGQMNVTDGDVRIGNPYYNTNGGSNITIGGGSATSTFTHVTAHDIYVGYGERTGSKDNVVTVSTNGVLTNTRNMYVGHINNAQNGDNVSTNNQLLVTGGSADMNQLSVGYVQTNDRRANANIVSVSGGGQLSTGGTAYIGRANNSGSESSSNTLTVSGTGSQWDAGNQTVYVGYTNNATADSSNNILTVGADGSVINVNNLIVGNGSGTETGNQLVLDGGSVSATTVTVSAGNTLSGNGTITGNTAIAGTLGIGVDGTADLIAITGDLDISAATLNVVESGSGAIAGSYTIVTYTGTLTPAGPGPFFDEGTLPSGYTVDYSTPGQINLVSAGVTYASWAAGFAGLTDTTASLDFDGGSLETGIEWVVGGDPTDGSDDAGNAPTGTDDGTYLVYTYNRSDDAEADPNTTITVQYGSTLAGWTTAVDTVDGVVITVTPGAPFDIVEVKIPKTLAVGAKLFARLDVVIAP